MSANVSRSTSGETRRRRSREAILEAAARLFIERGQTAVTTDDIAAEAGVSPRTFFNHFETRRDLVAAIAHERAVFVAAVIDAHPGSTPSDLFGELGRQISSYAVASGPHYPEFVALLTSHNATGDATRSGVFGTAFADFARRRKPASDVDAITLADLMTGALIVSVANFAADPTFDLAQSLETAGRALDALAQENQ